MKRCPKCEFLYEDDQSLCDMDGILLVFDGRKLPSQQSGSAPTKPQSKNRIVTAVAALVLASVLFLVYFVSTQKYSSGATYAPASSSNTSAIPTRDNANATAPASSPSSDASSAGTVENKTSEGTSDSNLAPTGSKSANPQPLSTQPAVAPGAEKKPATKPKSTQPKTSTSTSSEANKDDSKIGSLLKKTGRILKKPFKF
jgi:cytoskeletal protein RodZ